MSDICDPEIPELDDLAEARARLANLADLYRMACTDLARVTAERDAARAEVARANDQIDDLLCELVDRDTEED